jgi:hypothetical protein
MGSDDPFTRYYDACAHALLGQPDAALESLEKAAALCPAYTAARARLEPDLAGLQGNPRFQAVRGAA